MSAIKRGFLREHFLIKINLMEDTDFRKKQIKRFLSLQTCHNNDVKCWRADKLLKLNPNERTFTSRSVMMDTDFFRYCLIFVGSSPTWGDIFFLKSNIKWAFFIYSNTLESYVISLRGQDNLKTQKVQEISKIAIYLKYLKICSHWY